MNNEQTQNQTQTASITSLITGIVALLCGILAIISIPLGIIAIVFGIIGIKNRAGKGKAVTGIITGSIGLITGIAVPFFVFLAIPSLQRNQSDIAAKNDVSSAASGVSSYMANNSGALPTEDEFMSADFKDQYLASTTTSLTYVPGMDCSGNADARLYAITTQLASGEEYCVD